MISFSWLISSNEVHSLILEIYFVYLEIARCALLIVRNIFSNRRNLQRVIGSVSKMIFMKYFNVVITVIFPSSKPICLTQRKKVSYMDWFPWTYSHTLIMNSHLSDSSISNSGILLKKLNSLMTNCSLVLYLVMKFMISKSGNSKVPSGFLLGFSRHSKNFSTVGVYSILINSNTNHLNIEDVK